jgi:hypothetical protein
LHNWDSMKKSNKTTDRLLPSGIGATLIEAVS